MGKWFQDDNFSSKKWKRGTNARKAHRDTNARKIHRDINAWKLHRALGVLLAAALIFQTLPFDGIAVSASESSGGGLCEHHTEHTPDCGYQEAEPGHECTHEHTDGCYRTVEEEAGSTIKELDCHHEHDESCGYRAAEEESPCTFVCEICKGGTSEDNTDGNEINEGDSENPGTENGDEVKEPDNGQEECICKELCVEDSINMDCPVCGAEDASQSGCKGKDAEDSTEDVEENTKQPEGTGICKHHREHDDTCGYLPESEDSEGSPCTYECRICPVEELIAALPDAEDITEDNADEVRAQLEEILALFAELSEEEQEQIDLSLCYELQEKLDAANVPALVEEGTPDLELFGQKVCSGDSGDGWSYADGVLTLANYHSDNSGEVFLHITNADLDFTLYLKGDNSIKTSERLIYGNAFGRTTITGEPGSSLSLDGKSWFAPYFFIHGVNVDVTTQGMISLSYDMEIDNATVNFNMNGSNGYIYTTHGGFTIKNGSDVTITNSSGAVDYCVATNKTAITDSALKITNPSGFGVYVTKISTQVSEYKASITNSTISAYVPDAGIHCEDEVSVTSSQVTNSGQFLLRSKTAITVDDSSTMEGITYEFFNSDTGAAYQVYGCHTLAANLTVAENGSFVIPEGAALTIPDGVTLENNGTMRIHEKDSLTGTGALTGNGKFLIDVNEDMISVPEGLVYTGKDYTDQIILEENATVCGVEFTADTEGWARNIEPAVVKDAGEYTVTFTKGGKEISKTFTVAQSGTQFVGDGVVKTYKDGAACSDFTVDDSITVKATPTTIGRVPEKAAARLRSGYTVPAEGQMAVFVGDTQVSNAASADADGSYTMTVNASDVLEQGNVEPNGAPITLTAKFVGNDNMAAAAGTVDVNISAVAKVVNGSSTTYVGILDDAFKAENDGAIITLLDNVKITEGIDIRVGSFTLDLNGYTVSSTAAQTYYVISGNITIKDSGTGGKIQCEGDGINIRNGTVSIESGTVSGFYGVKISGGTVAISGDAVISGSGIGLHVTNAGKATLSGGTFSGVAAIAANNNGSVTLKNLLAEGYAYHRNNLPVTKAEGWVDSNTWGEVSLDTKATLTGTVTVQECKHTGEGVCEYTHATGTITHRQTCLACGKKWDEENCSFDENGKCPCGAVLAVTLPGNLDLTYTGTARTPAVTVTVDGTELAANNYTATYANNTNAGTATVTVAGKTYTGEVTKEFIIQQATPTLAWESTTQELTYTGKEAMITSPKATGPDDTQLVITHDTGPCQFSYAKQGSSTFTDGLPINAGTYTIKASVAAKGNYTAAESTNTLTLTVSYMKPPTAILYNGEAAKGWYNGDVEITAEGYTVSDILGGDYQDSYTISAQEGTVTKALYFRDAAGHMSDGVEVTVKFDLTPPTGEIAVGAKWWQDVLHFISFGNYAAKEYTVTIKGEDKNGSGIGKTEYAIVTGTDQYTDAGTLAAAGLSWTEYDSNNRPAIPTDKSQYVVYARLTDNIGNVTYISTDGILLDSTPPVVADLSVPEDTLKDVAAGFTFMVSEAADYYYVVLPQNSNPPSAADIIVTCGVNVPEDTGTAISGTFPKGSGAVSADTTGVSVEVNNLQPYTEYIVYVTAVDRALDITNSAEGTPAGNIADVQKVDFTTKKTLPVITKAPEVTGTYGQGVGEMIITGGIAKDGNTVLTGTWAVGGTDKDKIPSAGTAEVTVIFTPESDNYDSVSMQAPLTVSQRNLGASGVTVSEVAGTYTYTGSEIKPPVAVNTGTPASGIYISDSGASLTTNDFTVSYSNNKDAGTASVNITGKGNYTGSVTRTFTIGKAPGRTIPDLTGSYTDNGQTYTYTITPTEGAAYRMGDDGAWQAENIFEGITPGRRVTFYAVMPEDKNHEEGTAKNITVDFPKLTPAAPALSYKADRTNQADIKVTITPVSGAEYSFDGGKTWTESNEQGGFTTSQTVTLAIRLKETATHNPSPAQTVTVNLAKEDREAPPAFTFSVEANGETDYIVTIPATDGCEYSFDGETWTDSNVKTGVSVGETVTGYKRYKETVDYNASSAVSASKAMEKFTVKTPVISPEGGSYSGSVSVTITCGSPDAEIYYTTDGSTPGRSSARYTGAFTVTAPATVKAIAVKDGLTDSAVVSASYTKKNSGDSGGNGGGNDNSGGNEDNGGQGSGGGGSINPGNGNTTPQIPVIPPAENTNPGNEATQGTTPINPGNGNTSRPGSGAGTPAQGTKQPFIKGEDGKIGWDVIRAEEEKAQEGSTINVDMNGSVVVLGDIFDSIKGRDITITFDMGNGVIWSVDGKSITTDEVSDIDFSVKTGVSSVPVDIVNNVTGESYSIQISLAYEGEFGFTAVLSIGLGKENAGYTASLYYYNESTGELEFICADTIAEDGTVSLAFTHASDYVIAIDGDAEEESGSVTEPAQPENAGQAAGNGTAQGSDGIPGSLGTGQTGGAWWIIVILLLAAAVGAGVFVAVKKKGKDENGRQ